MGADIEEGIHVATLDEKDSSRDGENHNSHMADGAVDNMVDKSEEADVAYLECLDLMADTEDNFLSVPHFWHLSAFLTLLELGILTNFLFHDSNPHHVCLMMRMLKLFPFCPEP